MWKLERDRIATTILQMKNKVGGLTQTDVKTYSQARRIMIMLCWHEYKQTDEWSRIDFRNKPTQTWVNCFSTKILMKFSGETKVFSTNDTEEPREPCG